MEKKNLGGAAFLPLLVFLVLYVGCGVTFEAMGVESPFSMFPRHVALLVAIGVAILMVPSMPISDKVGVISKSMGADGIMLMILIYLMAGGFQDAAAAMGGKDSIVNLALDFIPVSFLIPGVFLLCCIVSTSIGTSMGTVAAMAPVAIGVAEGAGIDLALAGAAVIGGAYFGDNLSMISDTTISAAQGCGSEMKDKFKMNFLIALPAAILAMVCFGIKGSAGSGAIDVGAYNMITILPYIIVLVTALIGIPVVVVLFIGIISTGVIGLLLGTTDFFTWIGAIGEGMSGMFSISIVAALVSGIIGLIREYGGVTWLVNTITSKIRNRKGAEYGIGLMSGILSAALVNNTIAIIISAPMAKEIGSKYNIVPKRMASLIDIFACAFLALVPYDGGMLMVTALGDINPFDVIAHHYYIFFLIIAMCITIQFGLLRTKEEKAA